MSKTLIGPQLRRLRREAGETQAQMAVKLGVSPAYVNLLENNQRSLSVQVLLSLSETYGVDWRDMVSEPSVSVLADLRAAMKDPVFEGQAPDLQELRAAVDHAPALIDRFLHLYRAHRRTMDKVVTMIGGETVPDFFADTPETAIHDFFRDNSNHFPDLEAAAEDMRRKLEGPADDLYTLLKQYLRRVHGLAVVLQPIYQMPGSLREYDAEAQEVRLSEALDHPNRLFQLAHVTALAEYGEVLDELTRTSQIATDAGRARCRIELANYFASAVLMPYDETIELAQVTAYDVDRMAAALGTSFEMVCHRLTTLQRDGARGVPLFFLRIDKAGNVTKRFNATAFTLAEQGGACPAWNIHDAFRVPGMILPQFVELPDGGQFFTISRTIDRPVFSHKTQDRRLVVALGCERTHAHRIGYARQFNLERHELITPIGLNCHVCPRQNCSHRAHQPLHMDLPLDANRRGQTRYES